jgi:FkbM family methyltransferase
MAASARFTDVIIRLSRQAPMPLGRLIFHVYHLIFLAFLEALRTFHVTYIATTYFGAKLICDPTDLVERMIFYFGVWEPDVSRVIEGMLAPGDVFVDIGAHVGYHTLLGSHLVASSGSVVAIEASTKTFKLLQRNLALNDSSNVRAVNIAVADSAGKLDLYQPLARNIGSYTTLASRGGKYIEQVDALPLEAILRPEEIDRVRLIKMDIEGAELPILRQIIARLSHYPANMDILVEASSQDNPGWQKFFEVLIASGFRAYAIANSYQLNWYLGWRRLTRLEPVETMRAQQQDLLFSRAPNPF